MDKENLMRHWDSWVEYFAKGGDCSWIRDSFESVIDSYEEEIRILRFENEHLGKKVAGRGEGNG